jgi:hypothetical protein
MPPRVANVIERSFSPKVKPLGKTVDPGTTSYRDLLWKRMRLQQVLYFGVQASWKLCRVPPNRQHPDSGWCIAANATGFADADAQTEKGNS